MKNAKRLALVLILIFSSFLTFNSFGKAKKENLKSIMTTTIKIISNDNKSLNVTLYMDKADQIIGGVINNPEFDGIEFAFNGFTSPLEFTSALTEAVLFELGLVNDTTAKKTIYSVIFAATNSIVIPLSVPVAVGSGLGRSAISTDDLVVTFTRQRILKKVHNLFKKQN